MIHWKKPYSGPVELPERNGWWLPGGQEETTGVDNLRGCKRMGNGTGTFFTSSQTETWFSLINPSRFLTHCSVSLDLLQTLRSAAMCFFSTGWSLMHKPVVMFGSGWTPAVSVATAHRARGRAVSWSTSAHRWPTLWTFAFSCFIFHLGLILPFSKNSTEMEWEGGSLLGANKTPQQNTQQVLYKTSLLK